MYDQEFNFQLHLDTFTTVSEAERTIAQLLSENEFQFQKITVTKETNQGFRYFDVTIRGIPIEETPSIELLVQQRYHDRLLEAEDDEDEDDDGGGGVLC